MTNVGVREILALPKMPERQLRFLIALETFTCGEDGWREAGTELLASAAGLSVNTIVKARGELGASGAIEYRRGNGRGQVSTYRRKVPATLSTFPSRERYPTMLGTFQAPERYPTMLGTFQAPERYPSRPRKGTQTGPGKVPKQAPERYPSETSLPAETHLEV